MSKSIKLGITLGDPSGIGPEVIAKAISKGNFKNIIPLVIGSYDVFQDTIKNNNISIKAIAINNISNLSLDPLEQTIHVLDTRSPKKTDFPIGKVNSKSGDYSHFWIKEAIELTLKSKLDAIVTAPINKQSFHLAGKKEIGHQEILKGLTNSSDVYTMLVSGNLSCVHLSTHKSLKDACKFVTKGNIMKVISKTHEQFKEWGIKNPKIAVAALNPHSGDNGLIGNEEKIEIIPAIKKAKNLGINVIGPIAADVIFYKAIQKEFDVVIAMYHDQGHIAIKVHGFEESISMNVGLPIIRTSVDHGTAFDIAGKGIADETSMIEAMKLSIKLVKKINKVVME